VSGLKNPRPNLSRIFPEISEKELNFQTIYFLSLFSSKGFEKFELLKILIPVLTLKTGLIPIKRVKENGIFTKGPTSFHSGRIFFLPTWPPFFKES
jgi:hypothetical protein